MNLQVTCAKITITITSRWDRDVGLLQRFIVDETFAAVTTVAWHGHFS